MKTTDMSKDFAEARARGEAANEIDALRARLSEHDEARRRAYEALRGVMATEAGGLTGDPIVDAIGALRAALEEERLQHSHTSAAVEEYREGFTKRMQEIATLRTRAEQAEAERDEARAALAKVRDAAKQLYTACNGMRRDEEAIDAIEALGDVLHALGGDK